MFNKISCYLATDLFYYLYVLDISPLLAFWFTGIFFLILYLPLHAVTSLLFFTPEPLNPIPPPHCRLRQLRVAANFRSQGLEPQILLLLLQVLGQRV